MGFLRTTTVEAIMIKPEIVDENTNFVEVTKILLKTKRGCVFVTRFGKLIGIITDRDIQRLILKDGGIISPETTAKDFMIKPVVSVNRSTSIDEADQIMHKEKVNRLAVIDSNNNDEIIGLIDYNSTHSEIVTKFAKSLLHRNQYKIR